VVMGRVVALIVFILINAAIVAVGNINIVNRRSSPWFRCIGDLSRGYR
jgi:hypothetical protein